MVSWMVSEHEAVSEKNTRMMITALNNSTSALEEHFKSGIARGELPQAIRFKKDRVKRREHEV